MKNEANFTIAGQSLSIHTTDDQLREVIIKIAKEQDVPEDELYSHAKHTRDVTYNATATKKSDRW